MATSPVPLWAQEMSPHHRGPTAGGVLRLAVVAILLSLALQALPEQSTTERGGKVSAPVSTVPPCARHFPPTCERR
jgi:hypothetical protein